MAEKKIRSCIVLKDAVAKKNSVANEQFCVYIQCRRRPTDRLYLKFPFPAETDVLVPVLVLSGSTDVVVVDFVVVLKFPINSFHPC